MEQGMIRVCCVVAALCIVLSGGADSLFKDGGEKLVTEMSDDELMDLVNLDDTAVEK